MMKIILNVAIILSILVACSNSEAQEGKNNLQSIRSNDKIDYSKVVLKVERGAFHYDSFVLKQDSVVFIPKEDRVGAKKDAKYYRRSAIAISKEDFKIYIDGLINKGFLEMKDFYDENSTCTSGLSVSLQINGKTKTIKCTDFERGCPDLLYKIENDLIEMHGMKLHRKFLPG